MTTECLVALLDLKASLLNTAAYFDFVAEFSDRLTELVQPEINPAWSEIERLRLQTSASISLAALAARSVLLLPTKPSADFGSASFAAFLSSSAVEQLESIKNQFAESIAEIRGRRTERFPNVQLNRRRGDIAIENIDEARRATELAQKASETSHSHAIALELLERVMGHADAAINSARGSDWRQLAGIFRLVAKGLNDRLLPTQFFLSSVVDRQIVAKATAQIGAWDPGELAFAAYGLSRYEAPKEQDRTRLQLATRYVAESIAADGYVHPRRVFHRNGTSTMMTSSAFCITAWASLSALGAEPLSISDAQKLLPVFDERRKVDPATQATIGWVSEAADREDKPSLWSSALAVDALLHIAGIVGQVINGRVFPHFTVRQPSGPSLEDLFYPDAGCAALSCHQDGKALRRDSIGIVIQRMRAHIVDASEVDHISSLVLHGPAGTGKTTLAESLATTCGVALIEVTPSDISQAGADGVEGRARSVFEALGLLTKTVILFDEFDPVLQRRSAEGQDRNIFMFLTPGMLPKLKLLHDRAATRKVAYILNTNLIGSLDEAAIRQGRFDKKIGIYPPDVLARLGRLQLLCYRTCADLNSRGGKPFAVDGKRLCTFAIRTGGTGMTAMAKHGWFVINRRKLNGDLAATPIGHILGMTEEFDDTIPEPEETLPSCPRGSGQLAEREHEQWKFVNDWDQSARDLGLDSDHLVANLNDNVAVWLKGGPRHRSRP